MPNDTSSVYGPRPWGPPPPDVPPKYSYAGPWASNEERLCQQSIATAFMTAAQIREQVKPPFVHVRLNPSRFGYSHPPVTIEDIISLDRAYSNSRASWFSGSPAGYTGSSRNALG